MGSLVSKSYKNPAIAKQIEMASPMKQYLREYYGNVNPGKSVEEIVYKRKCCLWGTYG
jgi:hypothetical protein